MQNLLSLKKCSITTLSGTWLLPVHPLTIPQFNIFRYDCLDGYGGAAITVHNSLKVTPITLDDFTINKFVNSKVNIVGVQILNINSSPLFSIWSCYVLGDTHISTDLWLTLFSLISRNSLFIGDFNSFHPAWGSKSTSPRGNIIYNTINLLGLCILNDGSTTRLGRPGTANSALDLSFSSSDLFWNTT